MMKSKHSTGELFFSHTLDFLTDYLSNRMGRSTETQRAYKDSLTQFRKYLLNEKGISIAKFYFEDCTKELLLDFCKYLKSSGNSPSTCNARLAAIKSYVQYASDNDISLQSVALQVSKTKGMKIPKREKELLSMQALSALFAQPKDTKIGIRDRTIMILLYDSAIRVSELVNLRMNDVNMDSLSIHVIGKGNKERTVAITEKTAGHLSKYISLYHPESSTKDSYLFFTVIKGKVDHISTGTVERILQKYADEARQVCSDMPQKVYPHLLRAERATHLYRDGVDPIMISKILGHAQLETTKIYALPSIEQMREAMDKVPVPAEKDEKPIWKGKEDEMARQCGLR